MTRSKLRHVSLSHRSSFLVTRTYIKSPNVCIRVSYACYATKGTMVLINAALHIVKTPMEALDELDNLRSMTDCCLVIDGDSLQVCTSDCYYEGYPWSVPHDQYLVLSARTHFHLIYLHSKLYLDNFNEEFIELATSLPIVVCCRCSPTQKVRLIFSATMDTCIIILTVTTI